MQFLSPDKGLRSTANKSLSASNTNFNFDTNTGRVIGQGSKIGSGLYENFLGSESEWADKSFMKKVLGNTLLFSNNHSPLPSNNPT